MNNRILTRVSALPAASSVALEEVGDGANAVVEIAQTILFVGRVQPVVGQSKAHQNGRNAEVFGKFAHNWNRAAAANENGRFAEHLLESLGSDVDGGVIRIHGNRGHGAQNTNFGRNPSRRVLANPILHRSKYAVRILVGNKAQADLGDRSGRNYGFCAGSGKTARDAMDFKGRPSPDPCQDWLLRFARQRTGADFLLQKFFFGERQPAPAFEFRRGGCSHIVVYAGNLYVAVCIFGFGQQFNQAIDSIRSGTPIHAGMQIASRASRLDFQIHEATQADAERGNSICKQLGIGDERNVGRELLLVRWDVFRDRFAAHLFFALDQKFHIERQFAAVFGAQSLDRFDVHVHLALVVAGAARVDVAVAKRRLKRRSLPEFERVRRLHIVVSIAEHSGLAGSMQPVGIDERMLVRFNHFDMLHPGTFESACDELCRPRDIGLVLWKRADARYAKEIKELVEKARLIFRNEAIDCGGQWSETSLQVYGAMLIGLTAGANRKNSDFGEQIGSAAHLALTAKERLSLNNPVLFAAETDEVLNG